MEAAKFKDEVRIHFDERAALYDDHTFSMDKADFENFNTIIPYLIERCGDSILEIATGSGIILEKLFKSGKDCYGMDISPGLLRIAEEKRGIPAERLACGDAENLQYPDNRFDSVCVFRSLHHMSDQAAVLDEMIRCAKRNVFVYDSSGGWRRTVKHLLNKVGLYQTIYYLKTGQKDTGYRPPNETEGPVNVFYVEDAVEILQGRGLKIANVLKFDSSLLIHATKPV